MTLKRKNKKNTSIITDDLKLNRSMNVKLKTLDVNTPNVIEISFNFFAIPKANCEMEDYEESISKISKKYRSACKEYLKLNNNIFQDNFISDFNFTPANLKEGYNKYVTMSLYVKQKNSLTFKKIKSQIRNTIKDTTFKITQEVMNNGFKCSKHKIC